MLYTFLLVARIWYDGTVFFSSIITYRLELQDTLNLSIKEMRDWYQRLIQSYICGFHHGRPSIGYSHRLSSEQAVLNHSAPLKWNIYFHMRRSCAPNLRHNGSSLITISDHSRLITFKWRLQQKYRSAILLVWIISPVGIASVLVQDVQLRDLQCWQWF